MTDPLESIRTAFDAVADDYASRFDDELSHKPFDTDLLAGFAARLPPDAAVLDLDPINETTGFVQSGIIGGNFLRNFRVTFDFRKALLRFELLTALTPDATGPTRMGN